MLVPRLRLLICDVSMTKQSIPGFKLTQQAVVPSDLMWIVRDNYLKHNVQNGEYAIAATVNLLLGLDLFLKPGSLLRGVYGGLRALVVLPYREGCCRGFPHSIVVCSCSILGTVCDCLWSFLLGISKLFIKLRSKGHDIVHSNCALHSACAVLPRSMMPLTLVDGLQKGCTTSTSWAWSVLRDERRMIHKSLARCARGGCTSVLGVLTLPFVLCLALVFLVIGLVESILIMLQILLQGLSNSCYRRSAWYVWDVAPIQICAIEVPQHIRPPAVRTAGTQHAVQFAYSAALAQQKLPALKKRFRSKSAVFSDRVLAALPCDFVVNGCAEDFLVITKTHLAILRVSDWTQVTKDGRPERPRPTYVWKSWQDNATTTVNLRYRCSTDNWHLMLGQGPEDLCVLTMAFKAKLVACLAFESMVSVMSVLDEWKSRARQS